MAEDHVVELTVESALELLTTAVAKVTRQHATLQQQLAVEQAKNTLLQKGHEESRAKVALFIRLLDSHEVRLAGLEARIKASRPPAGTYNA